jgi:hypothetical protein
MSLNRAVLNFRFASCLMLVAVNLPAIADLPFDVRAPDFGSTAQVADAVSTTCADYNNKVSTTGVSAPGMVSHPGACGFSTFEILMDGQPVTQYWQLVLSGANPPPFKTIIRPAPFPQLGFCAVATNIRIELGAAVRPSVLSWPRAAAIGGACAAESGRHPGVDISGIYARGLTTIHHIGLLLNDSFLNRNTFEVCFTNEHPAPSKAPATLQLAAAIASKVQSVLASHQVASLEALFNQDTLSTNNCLLRCNQCGSGWAGTITNTQKVVDNAGRFLATEHDTYFVGGTATVVGNTTTYPADWTVSGSGFNMDGNKTWNLDGAAMGACPGSDQHVCFEEITDMIGARSFTETNPPLSINNAYQLTQNGAVLMSAAGENQFKSFISISASAIDTSAVGHKELQPAAIACTLPPLHSGVLTCTQDWDWNLFLQQ